MVDVEVIEWDRYSRRVGMVTLPDGSNLNHKLVEAGLAWWYRQYAPDDTTVAAIETAARDAHTGLWADSNPIPPWKGQSGPIRDGRGQLLAEHFEQH